MKLQNYLAKLNLFLSHLSLKPMAVTLGSILKLSETHNGLISVELMAIIMCSET